MAGKKIFSKSSALLERSIQLDEQEGPPLVKIAIVFTTVAVLLFLLWASFVNLVEVENAVGEIVLPEEPRRIMNLQGGVINELAVSEGDMVEPGQLLVRMDSSESESLRQQTLNRLYILYAQRERLTALIEQREPNFTMIPERYAIFSTNQYEIFQTMKTQDRLNRELAETQIAQAQTEIKRLGDRKTALERQIEIAKEETELTRSIVDRGAAARTELLARKRTYEGLMENQISLIHELEKTKDRYAEVSTKLSDQRTNRLRQLRVEISSVDEGIAQTEEQLKRHDNNAHRLDIYAPIKGIVHALNYKTTGLVINPGSVIMEILPTGESYRARVRIEPESIGAITSGNTARIKVSAYPFNRFGGFSGILTDVSPSTFTASDGRSFYTGIIEITGRELPDAEKLPLLPGMTLTAELKTGEKTLLQYLLKPVFTSAQEAFREK